MEENYDELSADERFRLLKANEIGFEAFGLRIDPELVLLSKVLQEGDTQPAILGGIAAEWFRNKNGTDYREMWDWVLSQTEQHGACPTVERFYSKFGPIGLQDVSTEPFSAIVQHFREVSRKRMAAEALNTANDTLKNGEVNADTVVSIFENFVEKDFSMRGFAPRSSNLFLSKDDFTQVLDDLVENSGKFPGVQSGYSGLDNLTRGFRPEQLITIIGEKKRGKSFLSLYMAWQAHLTGKVPAYVSIEMSENEIRLRLAAMAGKVALSDLINGTINQKEYERIRKAMPDKDSTHPFILNSDRTRTRTIDDIARLVETSRPDILFIDGAYLLQTNNKKLSTVEKLMEMTQGAKALAQDAKIPVVITTQAGVSRMDSKKNVDEDSAAWSSSYGQDSDLLLGFQRDPDDPNYSLLKILLARTHASGRVIRTHWDFTNMDFSQVGFFQEDSTADTEPHWFN